MKTKNILIKSQVAAALMLAGLAASLNSFAQSTDTWVGGSGNNFSTVANWTYSVGSGPVATTDSLIFDTVGSTTPNNDLLNLSFPSITYNVGAPSFTLGGNAFTLGTAGTPITVNSANAQTINNNLTLGNVAQTLSLATGSLTLGGVVSGGGNTLTLSGGQNLTLGGANTYAGTTSVTAGTAKVGSLTAFGASRVNLANGATIDLNGQNLSTAFINNSAALTGGIIDNVTAGGNVTLIVGGGVGGVNAASGTYNNIDSFSGIIRNTTGTVGLTKVAAVNQSAGIMATASLLNGSALLRLINANTYTGPTIINGGILELNFGQANNGGAAVTANIISSSSALVMAGGDLMVDHIGTVAAQTFSGVTLNAGASHLAAYRNSSSAATLNLNGITRNVGGTVDFQSRPSGASSNVRIGAADGVDNTTNVNANFSAGSQTILGGYATFNTYVSSGGGTWAVTANNTANVSKALAGLGTFNSGFAATANVDATIGTTTPASMFINSLRFNTAGAYTVNTAGNITNATGGILETLTVGANAVAINNNLLTSGNGQDLIIHQYNTAGTMTIGANIVDNGGAIGLTKSGPGALTLTPNSANTFSGPLTLNAGVTTLGGANALNGAPAVVFGGMSQTLGGAAPNFTYANGTLNLNGNSVTVASLTASTDSSGTAIFQNASATPATVTVNGSATTSFTGTLADGAGGGALSLVKTNSGTQTLGGTLSYSGSTTVGAGTLALTTTPTNTSSYAVLGTLTVTALTGGGTLALTSPQTLSGSGSVIGNVTVASGAHTRPGATGVTNTITGNLAYAIGAKADFDLNTSATSPNDQIILSGTSSVLNCGGVAININLIGATLTTNADYVLFKLTGGSASITNAFNSVPLWLGTVPANSGSYTIITDVVNKNVRLHFTPAVPPTVVGTASPATVVRNQSTFVSVTATPGVGSISTAYLDLTLINGTNSVPLTLSAVANVYTNTITIPTAAPLGSTHIVAYATDGTPLTGSGNVALTIIATAEIWNGLGSADNSSTNENWISVLAPGLIGDSLAFDGSTRLTPIVDNSYSVTGITFSNTAGNFVMSAANGSALTLTGGIVNNSSSAQVMNVPVVLTATQTVNTASGNLTLGSAITGGALTKVGNNTLFLGSGGNTFASTTISNGTVSINNNAGIGGGQITLAGGTLASGYVAGTRLTLGNNINVPAGNTGNISMSTLNRLNGTVTGGGVLNINAPGTQDDIGGGWNTYAGQINIFGGGTFRLVINGGGFNGFGAAKVTLTNASLSVSDNSTGNSFNVGAFTVDATATIVGSYLGNSPNYVIGGLNQEDSIAGGIQGSTCITKVGTNKLTLSGTVANTGFTTVNDGKLVLVEPASLDNSTPITLGSSTATIDVSGRTDGMLNLGILKSQALNGVGNITGAVSNLVGSTIKVGLGNLNISGAAFLDGTNILQLNRTNAITHSEIIAASFPSSSGPLTVLNVGPALQAGDSFALFNHPVTGFSETNLPALTTGLLWTNKLAINGTIAVLNGVNTTPTNITTSVTGNVLTLTWPTDHIGWRLQSQTNSLNTGLSGTWFDVAGATSVNTVNFTINPANGTVFYRMVYP